MHPSHICINKRRCKKMIYFAVSFCLFIYLGIIVTRIGF